MDRKRTALFLLATAVMTTGVASFSFHAVPQRAHVLPGGNVTIKCNADVSLTDCRFYLPATGYLDPNPSKITIHGGTTIEYSSSGSSCSITMKAVNTNFYNLVHCRGRDKSGVYKTDEMSLAVTTHKPFDLQIDVPKHIGMAMPNGEFSFICRSPKPLIYCAFWIPNEDILDLSLGASSAVNSSYPFKYEYHGSGLDKGECGIKFQNVQQQLNGVIWCTAMPEPSVTQFDYVTLIIAYPPEKIQLEVNGSSFYEGDILKATCSAENSRPASKITWFMGDDVITVGVADVIAESPFWPDAHFKLSVTQTLTKTLREDDEGKELRCVVDHVSLPGGRTETKKKIHVESNTEFSFVAKPQRAHVVPGGDVTLTCVSTVDLTDCRFRLPELGFLDLSTRLESNANRTYNFKGTTIEYFWRGRTCGITMKRVSTDFDDIVSCRGRNKFGKYKTAEIALAVSKLTPFPLTINERHALVLPGQDYTLLCRTPMSLIYCAIWLSGEKILDLSNGATSHINKEHNLDYKYHGAGLEEGECGVTFSNITILLNGLIWCEGQSEDSTDQSDYMMMTVAKRPNSPQLEVSPSVYNVGGTIEASCIVGNSRPAANISWFLGDQPITEGLHPGFDFADSPTWNWEYDIQQVSQNLTRRLEESDDGKELKCVATHVALPGRQIETKFKIKFTTVADSFDGTLHPNRKLINPEKCGHIQDDRRIFNGNKTRIFQYPWMAIILYESKDGVQFGCGGSLITDSYVLTAAHCVSNLPSHWSIFGVRLGEYDYEKDIDCQDVFGEILCTPPPQNFTVVKVIAHPLFSNSKLSDDVALVKLDRPAQFSDAVRPICLPVGTTDQRMNITGKWMVVAGWGITEMGGQSSDLRSVLVPVVGNRACAEHYVKRTYLVGKRQICAGGVEGQDSCRGDSGGPLMMVDARKGQFVQYGIVSYGAGVCGTVVPTVYTHVGHYIRWILDNLQ